MKKALSVLLCLCMVLTYVPVSAFAAETYGEETYEEEIYDVYIGDVPFTSENLVIDSSDISGISGSATLDVSESTYTLTLNNFQYTYTNPAADSDNGSAAIMFNIPYYLRPTMKLVLVGDNRITGPDVSDSEGLCVYNANVTISGDGSLTATHGNPDPTLENWCNAIYVHSDLTIDSGTLNACYKGVGSIDSSSRGITVNGTLTMNGGSITATHTEPERYSWTSEGMYVSKNLILNAGSIVATSGRVNQYNNGVFVEGDLIVKGGSLAGTSYDTTDSTGNGVYVLGTISVMGNGSVSGYAGPGKFCFGVRAQSIKIAENGTLFGSATMPGNAYYTSTAGIILNNIANGSITMTGGKIEAISDRNAFRFYDESNVVDTTGFPNATVWYGSDADNVTVAHAGGLDSSVYSNNKYVLIRGCDHTYNENFICTLCGLEKPYAITVSESENGTITSDKKFAVKGSSVTLTVTPDNGYLLDTLSVKQGETDVTVTNNAFTMPAGDVTVEATFKLCEHLEYIDGSCSACGNACPHTGGSATCTEKAVCETCGKGYGEVDKTNHTKDTYTNGLRDCCGEYQPAELNSDGYYEIDNIGQLYWFAEFVNAGNTDANAKLMVDIDLAGYEWTTICETGLYYGGYGTDLGYCGTFDGNGHIIKNITVKSSTTMDASCGLFGTVSGTIKNLGIEGFTFVDGGKDIRTGAIVGQLITANGKVSNCYVKRATITPGDHVTGGIAGCVYEGTIENCYVVESTITGASGRFGHIVGDSRGDKSESDRPGTVTNCYSDNATIRSDRMGNVTNCETKSTKAFASGEVTYLLNGSKSDGDLKWYQTIGTDSIPKFAGATVYKVSCEGAECYSNENKHYETHNFVKGICSHCGKLTPAVNNNDIYEISNVGQYAWFAEFVNAGNTAVNAKLMADIDLSEHGNVMIGTSSAKYSGNFDGNGKKLTVSFDTTEEYIAPFRYIDGATIQNLTVDGTIATSAKYAAGLVGSGEGDSRIEKCMVGVTINSSVNGDGTHGGLVAVVNSGSMTIDNCGFIGSITGNATHSCGGFVGWANGKTTIKNSYMSGTFTTGTSNCNTFGRNAGNITVFDSYYKEAYGTTNSGATQKSAEQFASGEVAYLLGEVWGQTIGEDDYPVLGGKKVYQITDCQGNTGYSNTETMGHVEVIITGKAPTCTEPGLTDGVKCSVCGDILTAQEEIRATGHTSGVAYKDNNDDTHKVYRPCCDMVEIEAEPHNYENGKCACGAKQSISAADLKFSGASLTLQDDLTINFKVKQDQLAANGYSEPYAVFVMNGKETVVRDYTVESGRYVFAFRNVSPYLMGDTVTATLYATKAGAEYVSAPLNYSVTTYCYNMLTKCSADSYAKLRTLLVDLLNYGAASQLYVNYNTDQLVNASLTDAQKAWGTASDRELTSVLDQEYATIPDPTVQWKGASLILKESVVMRFKIGAESVDGLTVKITEGNGTENIISTFEKTDGGYYVYFNALHAAQMSEPVYVTVYDGDTAVSNTVCYSIESYAASKQTDENTTLVNLLKAMMKYGDAAKAYVS